MDVPLHKRHYENLCWFFVGSPDLRCKGLEREGLMIGFFSFSDLFDFLSLDEDLSFDVDLPYRDGKSSTE